jgi:hypothetical protein
MHMVLTPKHKMWKRGVNRRYLVREAKSVCHCGCYSASRAWISANRPVRKHLVGTEM